MDEQTITKQVQIKFSVDTDNGKYQDALYVTEDEYNSLSSKDIENLKNERISGWVNKINTPPVVVTRTIYDIDEEINFFKAKLDALQLEKASLGN